jgi:hypothetical protein
VHQLQLSTLVSATFGRRAEAATVHTLLTLLCSRSADPFCHAAACNALERLGTHARNHPGPILTSAYNISDVLGSCTLLALSYLTHSADAQMSRRVFSSILSYLCSMLVHQATTDRLLDSAGMGCTFAILWMHYRTSFRGYQADFSSKENRSLFVDRMRFIFLSAIIAAPYTGKDDSMVGDAVSNILISFNNTISKYADLPAVCLEEVQTLHHTTFRVREACESKWAFTHDSDPRSFDGSYGSDDTCGPADNTILLLQHAELFARSALVAGILQLQGAAASQASGTSPLLDELVQGECVHMLCNLARTATVSNSFLPRWIDLLAGLAAHGAISTVAEMIRHCGSPAIIEALRSSALPIAISIHHSHPNECLKGRPPALTLLLLLIGRYTLDPLICLSIHKALFEIRSLIHADVEDVNCVRPTSPDNVSSGALVALTNPGALPVVTPPSRSNVGADASSANGSSLNPTAALLNNGTGLTTLAISVAVDSNNALMGYSRMTDPKVIFVALLRHAEYVIREQAEWKKGRHSLCARPGVSPILK